MPSSVRIYVGNKYIITLIFYSMNYKDFWKMFIYKKYGNNNKKKK